MNPSEFAPDGTFFNFIPGEVGSGSIDQFTATINGYKYFADGLTDIQSVNEFYTDSDNVHNRGEFLAGSANSREYQLQFPMNPGPTLTFQYAVIAHWVPADILDPDDIPGSFLPSANADEAIFLDVNNDNSDLWYSPSAGAGGGDISMDLEVFDQGGQWNPEGVPAEIGKIVVESPDGLITGNFVEFSGDTLMATARPGSGGNSSIVTVDIPGCTPPGLTLPHPLLITVESKLPTAFDPGTGNPPTSAALSAYFFYDGLEIANQQPSQPADPIQGNVALKVLRDANYAITGVQLNWTGNGNPEYAIYADLNPYDGIAPDTYIAATSAQTIDINSSNYPAFSSNAAYAFTVRARSVAGNPTSESTDSQYAFVEMEDFDGGAQDPSSEWTTYYMDSADQLTVVPGSIDGNALVMNPCPNERWAAALSPMLPAIADSEYSVFEVAQRTIDWQSGKTWPEDLAAMYANTTCAYADAPPVNGDPLCKSVYSLPLDAAIDGTWPVEDQLNPDSWLVSVSHFFGGDPTTWRGWRVYFLDHAGSMPPTRFSRLNIPEYRTKTDVYASIGFGIHNTYPDNTGLVDVVYEDELAVIIY